LTNIESYNSGGKMKTRLKNPETETNYFEASLRAKTFLIIPYLEHFDTRFQTAWKTQKNSQREFL